MTNIFKVGNIETTYYRDKDVMTMAFDQFDASHAGSKKGIERPI